MLAKQLAKTLCRDTTEGHSLRQGIIEYYSEAGPDYRGWSKHFNMHFGYYKRLASPFRREQMFQQMNKQVLDALDLSWYKDNRLLDMGCGVGATLRYAAAHYPVKNLDGITIVPWQIEQANHMAKSAEPKHRIHFRLADYRATPYEDDYFDGVYALESSCHIESFDKGSLLHKMYRILMPGKRMAIADGFLKGKQKLNPISAYAYRNVCRYWPLGNFGHIDRVQSKIKEIGFRDVVIQDISWNVAPSMMHIPFVAFPYFWREILLSNRPRNRQTWNHLMAPLFLLLLALAKKRIGYFLISAKK